MLFKLLAAVAGEMALFAGVFTWLQTGLGVVAVMASAAIVIATISLIMSGYTARRIRAMNKPADTNPGK